MHSCLGILLFLAGLFTLNPLHAEQRFELTVLHTNDLHSHFEGNGPDSYFTSFVGDGDPVKGNYARLAFLIKDQKNKNPGPLLTLDAGDFFGGTLFHVIGPQKETALNPEMDFFSQIELDYTTLGNHEFDAKEEGLSTMLAKAHQSGARFKIISSNLLPNKDALWMPFYGNTESSLIIPKAIKEFDFQGKKIKVGLLGIMGPDALLVSKSNRKLANFIGYDDAKNKPDPNQLNDMLAKEVAHLRQVDKADIIILIAHAGYPEDEEIIKNVPDLDLFIAGHTHDLYPAPKKIGKTWLAQSGEYAKFLGVLKFALTPHGLDLINPGKTHIPVGDNIEADPVLLSKIGEYKKFLKEKMAVKLGFDPDQKIVTTMKDYPKMNRKNYELGHLVAQGLKDQLERKLARPIDLYFTTQSLVRDGISLYGAETSYNFSDIFRILSIGMDQDMLPGTPVVHFYLSKREVEMLINFMEIYALKSQNFKPAFSPNLKYEVRWWGIPMINRLKDLTLDGKPYENWPELIHIATSEYVASNVDKVGPLSYGLVEFIPKDENGKPLKAPVMTPYKEYQLFSEYLLSRQVLK